MGQEELVKAIKDLKGSQIPSWVFLIAIASTVIIFFVVWLWELQIHYTSPFEITTKEYSPYISKKEYSFPNEGASIHVRGESQVVQTYEIPSECTFIGVKLPPTNHIKMYFGAPTEKQQPSLFSQTSNHSGAEFFRVWLLNNNDTSRDVASVRFSALLHCEANNSMQATADASAD